MATDRRKLLREKWYRVLKADHVPEWGNQDKFLAWYLAKTGGRLRGFAVRRYNINAPYGPGNCYVQELVGEGYQGEDTDEMIARWNKTVNVFRRAAGLPLFKEE